MASGRAGRPGLLSRSDSPAPSHSLPLTKHLLTFLRLALLAGGIVALVLLIDAEGADKVLDAIWLAAPWLPVLFLFEAAWVGWDVLAVRSLYGRAGKRVPWSMYIRSALIAYPFMGLLPAGRAGAEAARATCLAPWVGAGRASAVGVQAQAAGLAGNFLMSAICLGVVGATLGPAHWIFVGLMINGTAGLVGSVLIFLAIRGRLGGFLGRRFAFLKQSGTTFDRHVRITPVFPPAAIFYSMLGRMTQGVQYVFFVVAVGGSFNVVSGIVAQAIHIIAALVGDLVPSQLGVTDGAYSLAAQTPQLVSMFGLAAEATAAVFCIALLGRLAQIFWSLVGALVPIVWKVPPGTMNRARRFATSHLLSAVGPTDPTGPTDQTVQTASPATYAPASEKDSPTSDEGLLQ